MNGQCYCSDNQGPTVLMLDILLIPTMGATIESNVELAETVIVAPTMQR